MISSLTGSLLIEILKLGNFTPVILALELEDFNLLVEVSSLKSEISINVTLLGIVLVKTKALEVTVIEKTLLSGQFLLQIVALLVPIQIECSVTIVVKILKSSR